MTRKMMWIMLGLNLLTILAIVFLVKGLTMTPETQQVAFVLSGLVCVLGLVLLLALLAVQAWKNRSK